MRIDRTLYNAQQANATINEAYQAIKPHLMAGSQFSLQIKPKTRSTEQNSRMWAMLTEVSNQVEWYGRKLTPEAWKCVFSASLKKQDVVPGLHGDFVVIGQSTSQMSVREMSDLQTFIEVWAAENGVTLKVAA